MLVLIHQAQVSISAQKHTDHHSSTSVDLDRAELASIRFLQPSRILDTNITVAVCASWQVTWQALRLLLVCAEAALGRLDGTATDEIFHNRK